MFKTTLGFAALVAFVTVPFSTAFAATTQVDLYSSYALAYAGTVAQGAVDVDTGINAAVDTGATVDTNTTINASVDGDASVESNGDATPEEGSTFTFTRTDMADDASVTSSSMVSTQADLEAYASAAMAGDERLEKAEFSNTSVTVWYKHPAKVLGFIPVDMTVKATADASGNVNLSYPWYSFMASAGDKAELEASLENQIRSTLDASASGSVEGESAPTTFTSRTQAEVMTDLAAALEASIK